MASGLLGTGVSGLMAAQRALSTASHNIANVNTDGYSRQRVDQVAQDPLFLGNNYEGTGVRVKEIKRIFNEFSAVQIRDSTAGLNQAQTYRSLAARVDNLFNDSSSGLLSSLQAFYDSVQGVANSPASLPERQVMLRQGDSLAGRFHSIDGQLQSIRGEVNSRLSSTVAEINALSESIAGINHDILMTTSAGAGQANDMLDKRDEMIRSLSEMVATKTVTQRDGQVNVSIGNGQALVTGNQARKLLASSGPFDVSRLEVAYDTPQGPIDISGQIKGGVLGGLIGFRNQVLDTASNTLGKIAVGVAATANAQHRQGMDLNGNMGGDLFYALDNGTTPATVQVLSAKSNANVVPARISATISDIARLGNSDYRLDRKGAEYSLTRLFDGQVTRLTGFPAMPAVVDGVSISLDSGSISDGDAFYIQPTRKAAAAFVLKVSDPAKIAAAAPQRSSAAVNNAGQALVSPPTVTDPANYVSGDYQIQMGASTAAVVDGVRGKITDGAAPNALRYDLTINGVTVYRQDKAAPLLSDLNALAAVINDDVAMTGVRAYVDVAGNKLLLANDPMRVSSIKVSETLVDAGGAPLDGSDTMTGYFGGRLAGPGPSSATSSATYASADAYLVTDAAGVTVSSGAYVDATSLNFKGMTVTVSGNAVPGDRFTLSANTNGIGDNRNALALAGLQSALLMDSGSAGFKEIYSQVVVDVGSKTAQAEINTSAQDSLLTAALARRSSTSGVNLDEEAASILKFQQAYQASAQVISMTNTLFQSLLAVFR